jgi:4-amino-4-deoxy-L-arabinose transferase-like glycosyltransferase
MFTLFDRRDGWWFALIFAALLARLALLPPIWQHGEAREGLVVLGIVDTHQWILPFRNGELPSKPPLFHWLAALFAWLIGMNDLAVRLPSVLAAQVMAIATYLIARTIGSRITGWLAVGALLGTYEFWDSGTQARVDMLFSACVTVSLAGFFFWYQDRNTAARATCYLAAAFAVLAKGPAGVVLPAVVIVSFLAAQRELPLLRKLWSWQLVACALILDLGWYALAYQVGGDEFFRLQIERENVGRALGTMNVYPHAYLAPIGWLASLTFPLSLALLWSALCWVRGSREDAAGRFFHLWWFSILVMFTLAVGKRAVYLLPLYPAVAVLAARAIEAFMARPLKSPLCPIGRRFSSVKAVFGFVVVMDLCLMFADRDLWRDDHRRIVRFAFVEKINSILTPRQELFASPELDDTVLTVMAYRLRREIKTKPIAISAKKEFFLAPLNISLPPGVKGQFLAFSEIDRIGLLTLLFAKSAQ